MSMDVAAWLRGLGLEQYERTFHENAVDADVLPELTAEDLRDLGVRLVGHRRKLLAAIATLREATPSAGAPPTKVGAKPGPPPPFGAKPSSPEAERRQITVMFCDLVGSTELAAQLDPEDLREVISAYQRTVADVIGRWGGHVAKYLGDGVLAYFGYPRAHEDDAERAVRAGLAVVDALPALRPREGVALQGRVGIATGVVVVGDLIGEGAAREEAVVGETPNLAARLQSVAEPGAVVIAPGTRRLLGGLFDLVDLGGQSLKGFAEPVPAWRVLGSSAAESRFEARQTTGLTPLVGREEELALLLRRWEQAKEGEGQVVLLAGEPGIGKSRLVRALRERLAEEPHTPLSHFCSPYHVNSALHPVIGLLERAAVLRREDPPERQLDKLEALLALATEDLGEAAPLLADLLAIPSGGRYPPLELRPQLKKEKTLRTLVDQLTGLAARQPVLALYEDVHWIDPTSLELLGRVVEEAQHLPVLIVITFRPEFSPPWSGHAHVMALSLSRLGRRQGAAIVERVTGGKELPAAVVEQIIAKTDGVPLFVEEVTKAVLEAGLLRDLGDHYELTGPLPTLAVPATLRDSLSARLDHLGPAKEVAQIGGAIGREFAHKLLAVVAPLDEAGLRAELDRLASAELIFRRGTPPHATYTFKHALVRDAAYDGLLRSRRQQIHTRIAQVLEQEFPETAATEPETLAQHYAEAGDAERAVDYWLKAGRRAAQLWNNKEAVDHLTRGLTLLKTLPDGPERAQRELDFQITLGPALMTLEGYGAAEVEQAYKRAYELCEELRLEDSPRLLRVLYGLRRVYLHRGALQQAQKVAERCLHLAEQMHDMPMLIDAHYSLSVVFVIRGELISAQAHADEGSFLGKHPAHAAAQVEALGVNLGPICRATAAWSLWAQGYPDQARKGIDDALTEAREQQHPFTLAHVLFQLVLTYHYLREVRATHENANAAIALAREHGFPQWVAWVTILRGWTLAELGRREEGIAEMRQGLTAASAIGTVLHRPYYVALLAEAHGKAGRTDEGLRLIAEALALAEESEQLFPAAELYRLRGELLLSPSLDEPTEAETCFHRALDVARNQGAASWELRAATSLARLWRDQGKHTEAHDLLATVYGWFTEGFDTPDLKDAKVLLDELG